MPGKWKEVQHENTVTWLATWTENINNSHKYVFLAAGSSLKGQSDMSKFEKSRELKVSSASFLLSPRLKSPRNTSNAFARIIGQI
jgi:Eukaryotic DNA topoisomerase I, DNA binding fragment